MKRTARRVQSPCIDVCRLDPKTAWCLGCARTAAEIRQWPKLTPFRRSRLGRELTRRLVEFGQRQPLKKG